MEYWGVCLKFRPDYFQFIVPDVPGGAVVGVSYEEASSEIHEQIEAVLPDLAETTGLPKPSGRDKALELALQAIEDCRAEFPGSYNEEPVETTLALVKVNTVQKRCKLGLRSCKRSCLSVASASSSD
ncbi:hypothetical protein Agub_g14914 [Astrephomene gubernaculifera]|uniref:HicB-like antitoxin of toxin-antitoxin system domain-containing protein n=1 Tax=Astrephomene gubernaculifera TaxID=47775 RepID=A0AAD3HTJ9_9CHLO|nr:hypothetical protein Agub_g14914 [Astrephomene gubernaculifera]